MNFVVVEEEEEGRGLLRKVCKPPSLPSVHSKYNTMLALASPAIMPPSLSSVHSKYNTMLVVHLRRGKPTRDKNNFS